ncbi:MAG: hemerythrin domain-containing protein [Pontibacterium sp.]
MTILTELHQDHINLNKMLAILQLKVGKLRAGDHPNFSLMADVVSYISDYADAYHHRREDCMYKHFYGRDPALDKLITSCEDEHRHMKYTCTVLSETIEGILHDAVVPMDAFTDRLASFLDEESAHIDKEDKVLFPMLQKLATEQDWAQLLEELPRLDDPLFGEKQAVQYADLYNELVVDMKE